MVDRRSVTKAVIPVAGLGTRMLPASKAIPKEMLPIVDRPAIEYVVHEAAAAGITQIVLVTQSSKSAIENYFDPDPALEEMLESRGKVGLVRALQRILPEGVSIISVRQPVARGLGHAIACAAPVVDGEPFAVLLPDVLVESTEGPNDLGRMVQRFAGNGAGQILVEEVPLEKVGQYGIVKCPEGSSSYSEFQRISGIVEKPSPEEAPSRMAVVGRYVLPGEIMSVLRNTPPGAGGEIQLTDAIATLMEGVSVEACSMRGRTFDCGNKLGYLEAAVHFGMKNPEFGDSFRALLKSMLD